MVVVYFCPGWFQQRRAEKTEEGLVTGADKANSNNKLPLRQSAGRKFLRLSVVVFLLSSFATVAEQDGDGEGNSTKHTGHQPIVGRRLLGQNAPASQIHVLSHYIQLPPLPPIDLGATCTYYAPYVHLPMFSTSFSRTCVIIRM